jgi:hypothetical protein
VLRVLRVSAKSEGAKPSFPQELVESLADEIELRVREGSANRAMETGGDGG